MKTPQEEAESLVCYAENTLAQRRPNYNNLPVMDREVSKAIVLTEIPLPELIAVARAAKQRVRAIGYVEQTNCEELLIDALQALRATGKVEL